MKNSIVILVSVFCTGFAFSQNYEWSFNIGSNNNELVRALDTDNNGNIYSTGFFEDNLDFNFESGTSNLILQGSEDIFIQKTSSDGTFSWAKSIGSANGDQANDIVVDGDGNLIVTGYFTGAADFNPGMGATNLSPFSAHSNGFVLKLDDNGDLIWVKQFGLDGHTYIETVDTDNFGNIYVSGSFINQTDLDPNAGTDIQTSASNYDAFIVKLDVNGNFIWSHIMSSAEMLNPESISVNNGKVVLVGNFDGTAEFNPAGPSNVLITNGLEDMFVMQLSDAGVFEWVNQYGSVDLDNVGDVEVDDSGNIHLTGGFGNTIDFDTGIGVFNSNPTGIRDIFVLKLDNTGNLIWVKHTGSTSFSEGDALTVDPLGNIYTTGFFKFNVDFDLGAGDHILDPTSEDIFVWKLDANGSYQWAQQITGDQGEFGTSIALDQNNDLILGGYFEDSVDFDFSGSESIHFSPNGNFNLFVTKWENCSNQITQLSLTECGTYLSPSGNTTYTTSGIYYDTLSSFFGCDSILEINLTLNQIDDNIQLSGTDFNAVQSGGTYQWLNCDNSYSVISGETSQSFTPTVGVNYACEITYNGCTDTTECANLSNVSLNETEGVALDFYPNPTRGEVYFNGNSEIIQTAHLLDLQGKVLSELLVENNQLKGIENFEVGTYLIRIESEMKVSYFKIIKQ